MKKVVRPRPTTAPFTVQKTHPEQGKCSRTIKLIYFLAVFVRLDKLSWFKK
jgi:hypothetical protein